MRRLTMIGLSVHDPRIERPEGTEERQSTLGFSVLISVSPYSLFLTMEFNVKQLIAPALVCLTTLSIVRLQTPQAQTPADLVLLNGQILTVDARDSIAQAVAIAGGRIVAVGTDGDVRARVGNTTE